MEVPAMTTQICREEVRRAYLLNHLKYGTEGLTAYEILKVATRGGAEVLGRNDCGKTYGRKGSGYCTFRFKWN